VSGEVSKEHVNGMEEAGGDQGVFETTIKAFLKTTV
jgi:hypothetical protein